MRLAANVYSNAISRNYLFTEDFRKVTQQSTENNFGTTILNKLKCIITLRNAYDMLQILVEMSLIYTVYNGN